MTDFELLSEEWINRLQGFKQLIVGFSGGLDSTVLLHLLASYPSLHPRILAVHVNHGISANALDWQNHCALVCLNLNISLITEKIDFDRSSNIEEEARNARFAVFSKVVTEDSCLLLGHHLDDQAETVLLHLFRGAGVDGLAGIKEYTPFDKGILARPLLQFPRAQLLDYARTKGLCWIEDESNTDASYSRNYLRHQIFPLLIKKWPGVVGNLSRTAAHCQQAQTNLYELALQDCNELHTAGSCLSISSLKSLDEGRIINVLRTWLRKNIIQLPPTTIFKRLVHEVLWASSDAEPVVSWNDVSIRCYKNSLYIVQKTAGQLPKELKWKHFPKPLVLAEGYTLFVTTANAGLLIPNHAELSIKFREGGEQIVLHQQTKQLKKLFQEWQIPPWLRNSIPILYINGQLAAVIGYAVSDLFYTDNAPSFIINF
jgi:tRNA(Ile)-lysidine synthase